MSAARKIIARIPAIEPASLPEWAEWLWSGFGCDTAEISEILNVPEADVCRMLPRKGEERETWTGEVP